MTPRTPKLDALEAVRGLAALSVVVGHLVLAFWPAVYFRSGPGLAGVPPWAVALARFPGKFLWDGELAVTVFFVLSGFVLSLAYFRGAALGGAAVRRFPRLMLPVLASVLLAWALMAGGFMASPHAVRLMDAAQGLSAGPAAPGHSNNWLRAYYGFTPDLRAALVEGTIGAFRTTAHYNLVLWTMPIELIGSFLVYAGLTLFGAMRNRGLLYALGGAALLAGGHVHLFGFVLGMALCDVWMNRPRPALGPWAAAGVIALAVFAVPLKPLAGLLIVAAVAYSPAAQRGLSGPALTWLGRVSFGLYLVHMPVVCSLGCGVYVALAGWGHHAAGLTASAAALAGSLLAAWAFTRLVDGPTLRLTRALEERVFRPVADDGAAAVPIRRAA